MQFRTSYLKIGVPDGPQGAGGLDKSKWQWNSNSWYLIINDTTTESNEKVYSNYYDCCDLNAYVEKLQF